MNRTTWILVGIATLIAVGLRLSGIPTLNFSALGALAIFCGAVVRPAWLGLTVVLAARLLTDAVLELRTGHGWYGSMLFDYSAYAMMFGLGRLLQPRHPGTMVASGLSGAVIFFVVSNLGAWAMPHEPGQYLYPQTLAGLRDCFINAIPFARGTFAGDYGFTLLFLGSWNLLESRVTTTSAAVENA